MTVHLRVLLSALAVLSCAALCAEDAPSAAPASAPAETASPAAGADEDVAKKQPSFERYKTIIDRKPFGKEPPNFNPDAPSGSAAAAAAAAAAAEEEAALTPSEEEQQILSSVRVSVLNVTPDGKTAVGFTDSGKSPAVNYYMMEGESRDGWTFKSASVADKTVVISRNNVDVTIPLGGGAGGKDGARKGGRPQAGMMRAASQGRNATMVAEAGGGGAFAHLRARRARKEADQKAEAEAAAAAAAQEKADREQAAAEREQQRTALMQIQEELRRAREERQAQQPAATEQE